MLVKWYRGSIFRILQHIFLFHYIFAFLSHLKEIKKSWIIIAVVNMMSIKI